MIKNIFSVTINPSMLLKRKSFIHMINRGTKISVIIVIFYAVLDLTSVIEICALWVVRNSAIGRGMMKFNIMSREVSRNG